MIKLSNTSDTTRERKSRAVEIKKKRMQQY